MSYAVGSSFPLPMLNCKEREKPRWVPKSAIWCGLLAQLWGDGQSKPLEYRPHAHDIRECV